MLNVALGGTLVQDIPRQHSSAIDHHPATPRSSRSHAVEIHPDSRLAEAVGATSLSVNSIHHQAVDVVADVLRVVAVAPDGIIEGVEYADADWWCVAVQWHPEELQSSPEPWDQGLFSTFAAVLHARMPTRELPRP